MLDFISDRALRTEIHSALLVGMLVTARVIPFVQLAPFLGGKALPQTLKMGIALAMAVLVFPSVVLSGQATMLPESPLLLGLLVVKEALIGLMLGFTAALAFDAVRMAGQLIDNARGQTMATALVPQLPERVSVSADLLYQLAVVIFFATGAHGLFLAAFTLSFQAIPPTQILPLDHTAAGLLLDLVRVATHSIALGVLLAFPVIATILLTEMLLAFVNRAAPQINVFFLGMPLKAMVGAAVLLLTLSVVMERFVDDSLAKWELIDGYLQFFEGLKPP